MPTETAGFSSSALGVRSAFVFISPNAPVLDQLASLIDAGKLRTLIGGEFPLRNVADAHALSESVEPSATSSSMSGSGEPRRSGLSSRACPSERTPHLSVENVSPDKRMKGARIGGSIHDAWRAA